MKPHAGQEQGKLCSTRPRPTVMARERCSADQKSTHTQRTKLELAVGHSGPLGLCPANNRPQSAHQMNTDPRIASLTHVLRSRLSSMPGNSWQHTTCFEVWHGGDCCGCCDRGPCYIIQNFLCMPCSFGVRIHGGGSSFVPNTHRTQDFKIEE